MSTPHANKVELVKLDVAYTEDGYELYAVLHAGYEGIPQDSSWGRMSDWADTGYFFSQDSLEEWVEQMTEEGYIKVVADYIK